MGPPALLSIRKEGVLRIFIALKNLLAWPGSNAQLLGPVASTLTTAPPRRLQGGYNRRSISLWEVVSADSKAKQDSAVTWICFSSDEIYFVIFSSYSSLLPCAQVSFLRTTVQMHSIT
jgi:hypothetical protein